MSKRAIMRIELNHAHGARATRTRPYSADDEAQLGQLLFDAYLGTVDQEEDTLDQASAEITKTISGEYGIFLPRASMVVDRQGVLHSATLVTRYRDRPFVAFCITHPSSKNQGLARACMLASMAELAAAGEHELHLVVTLANAPAVRLYKALGFEFERAV